MNDPQPVNTSCSVSPNDDLVLDLVIGNAQLGTSVIFKDDVVKDTGDFAGYQLGRGRDWIGHDLDIKTVITDVNSATNRLVVTYRISVGGKVVTQATNAVEVANANDSAVFFATVKFTAQ